MKKQILLFYILLCGIIYGQSANNYAPITYPTSPDVTKMQTYGQVPVTPYSGLANVSIPIYTIKEGDFEFPISLNYNTRGIKVKEEATRVGLGWSLGFPGLISRSINGQDDFLDQMGNNIISVNERGKYFNAKANDGSLVPDFTGYMHGPQNLLKLGLDTRIMPNNYLLDHYTSSSSYKVKENTDFQPDDFFYNLPKYSGKFIFRRNKQPVLEKLQDNLKIEILDSLDYLNQPKMKIMKVVDPSANIYIFKDFERLVYQGSNVITTTNAWYISSIKTPNGNEIKFKYDNLETIPSYNLFDYAGIPINRYNDCADGTASCGNFPFGENKSYEGLKFFHSKLIKKIEFSKGSVEFEYENREDIYNDKKISKIILKDLNNQIISVQKLNHNYFIANYNTIVTELGEWQQNMSGYASRQTFLNKRLKFTSIDLLDKNNNIVNSQEFEYFDTNIPAKNSTAVDLWGYFNGVNNNPHLFPEFDITVPTAKATGSNNILMSYNWGVEHTLHIPGADRNVYPNFTNSMLLKKIVYPTKGSTSFEYENNTYNPTESFVNDPNASKISFFKAVSNNNFKYSGGLRINKIITNNGEGSVYIKKYNYHSPTNQNLSNGILLQRPQMFDFRKARSSINDNPVDENGLNGYIMLKSEPNYDQNFIGYKNVVEETTDNIASIQKKYEYFVIPSQVYSNIYSLGRGFPVPSNIFTEPNNISYKNFYNSNAFQLRQYNSQYSSQNSFRDYSFDFKPYEVKDEISLFNGLLKSVYSYKNNGLTMVESEEFAYNPMYNLNQYWGVIYGLTVDERMGYVYSYFKYHDPFYISIYPYVSGQIVTKGYSVGNYNLAYKALLSIYNPGATKKTLKKYLDNGQISTHTTEYQYGSHTNNLTIGNLILQTDTNSDLTINESIYKYAFEKGNTKLINANMIAIPLETSVIKKQNNSDVGKILSKTETKYDNPSNLFPTSILSSDLQNPTVSSVEATYDQYDSKGNILQYTTKDGVVTSIIWGYNSTQPIAKVTGVPYSVASLLAADIISASNADIDVGTEQNLIDKLDLFRKQFASQNAQISTYTYDPLIGVTSITPPSGIREIYKYDSANRLESIRDENGKLIKEFKYNYKN